MEFSFSIYDIKKGDEYRENHIDKNANIVIIRVALF